MVVDIPTDTKTKATDDLGWRVDSVCREHPTQLWFAASPHDTATAKALCAHCTVQSRCLEFALSRPELLGIWAATTPSERAVLRRAARAATGDDAVSVEIATTREQSIKGQSEPRAPEDGWRPGEAGPPVPARQPDAATAATDDGVPLADDQPDELLTPAEAARRLGVTPNTVTRWSRAGKISAIQTIGGHRRYWSSEIEKVLRRVLQ
jgi:excisionase family DNA binding protein